jgi:hypothetical protein
MNVGEARRICYDGVRNKGTPRWRVRIYAGFPATLQHFIHHLLLLSNLPCRDAFHLGQYSGVLDHILCRISHENPNSHELNCRRTAINWDGSPPIGKNSSPDSRTNDSNTSWVAIRTLCPKSCNSFPRARNGWTSPAICQLITYAAPSDGINIPRLPTI